MDFPELNAVRVPVAWKDDMSIYASEPYLRSVGDDFGWLAGVDPSGVTRCILPYTVVRKSVLRMIRFRVETHWIGEPAPVESERAFLGSAMRLFRDQGADVVIPATTNTIFRTYPEGADAAPYGSHVVDLRKPEDALLAAMSSNHRRQIRTAQKAGILIREAPELAAPAHEIVRNTFSRSKLPFMELPAFERLLRGLDGNIRILVAELEGRVHGCIVVPFSRRCAYYAYGGSIDDAAPGCMHLLHWEAMRRFRSAGVERYDFVGTRIDPEKGSKQEGLATFKDRFGGSLVEGYIWKYSLRPLKAWIYHLGARCRSGGDIVDQERHKLGKPRPAPQAPSSPTDSAPPPATETRRDPGPAIPRSPSPARTGEG